MEQYLGMISGTSLDAIDVALLGFDNDTPTLLASHAHAWQKELREQLLHITQHPHQAVTLQELAELDRRCAMQFAEAVHALLAQANISPNQVTAIGSPGQTLYHQTQVEVPVTWQLGDPATLHQQTGIPVVADFRRHDLARGGQAAPLASSFHLDCLSSSEQRRVVLNLGGIANVTRLFDEPLGFDTGPANALLDAWAMRHLQQSCDVDGRWAASGQVQEVLLEKLLADPYFNLPLPKTTGRDYFNLQWLDMVLDDFAPCNPVDVQATLTALTAQSVADAICAWQPELLAVCGGGAHNPLLLSGLQAALPNVQVVATDELGVPADWMEAMCFAWLARQRMLEHPLDLRAITGAKTIGLLGAVYCS